MEITLKVDPLSVNKAWKGRRFKTKEYDRFERDVAMSLQVCPDENTSKEEVFVYYVFHIRNYGGADTFNMEKTLSDMLVKRGYIYDDRYIRAGYVRKEKVDRYGHEFIEIQISPYTGQDIRDEFGKRSIL